MKIALVADWLTSMGGAERVLLSFSELYPTAPIYTSVYNAAAVPAFSGKDIRPSFLQQVPFARTHHQLFPTLRPLAFESLDLSAYDVVISSASAEAKGVITKPETCHISYCHTPTRYYWSDYHAYKNRLQFGPLNALVRWRMPRLTEKMRLWDYAAAQRVDSFIANSRTTAERISKYYHRDATVIYPPVDTETILPAKSPTTDFFLVVSRLVPYKYVSLVVQAFNGLRLPLKIVGTGPEREQLQSLNTNPHTEFLGDVSESVRNILYQQCIALIFPPEEDAGITPLEAMAAGKPVIAFKKGGATETVIAGKTGLFFDEQTVASLIAALTQFDAAKYDPAVIRAHAERFSKNRFKNEIKTFVDNTYQDYIGNLNSHSR